MAIEIATAKDINLAQLMRELAAALGRPQTWGAQSQVGAYVRVLDDAILLAALQAVIDAHVAAAEPALPPVQSARDRLAALDLAALPPALQPVILDILRVLDLKPE